MNKKIVFLLFFVTGLAQAQDQAPLPPPKAPFVAIAKAPAAWTVTYKPKKKAAPTQATKANGPGGLAVASEGPRMLKAVQVFKAGKTRRMVYYWDNATKNEKWWIDGVILSEDPGNPEVYLTPPVGLPWMPPVETYTDTDFPEFRWIQAGMYVPDAPERDPSGMHRPHYLFQSVPLPPPGPDAQSAAQSSKKHITAAEMAMLGNRRFMGKSKITPTNLGMRAWIDAQPKLPIAFDDGLNVQFYTFDPNPPTSLELPPKFAEKMAKKKKFSEELARHIIHEPRDQ